jgi:hypothetical protein
MQGIEEIGVPGRDLVFAYTVDEMIAACHNLLKDEKWGVFADAAYLRRDTNLWSARLKTFIGEWGTW